MKKPIIILLTTGFLYLYCANIKDMTNLQEIWKSVSNYEGCYEVSNLGRVKSLHRVVAQKSGKTRTVPELILAIIIQDRGYPVVTLSRDGLKIRKRVSRLVAIEHVPNPLNLPEVNHDDGNKLNCRSDNLSWTDRSGNIKHAYRTGLRVHHSKIKSCG